jgi:hypothetical protein
MAILSNMYMFPLLQALLLLLFLFALWEDYKPRKSPFGGTEVKRGDNSMSTLNKATGFAISIFVALVNSTVFSDKEYLATRYSIIINVVDFCVIIYICYISPWGRNRLITFNSRLRKEPVS